MCEATSHVIPKIYSAEYFFKIGILDNLTPSCSLKIIEKLFRKEFHIDTCIEIHKLYQETFPTVLAPKNTEVV